MDAEDLYKARHKLLFDIRRSVRYHRRRRGFFDFYRLGTSAMSALFGSAAVATIVTSAGQSYTIAAALAVTVFSVLDLVIGSARMARLHEDLSRRFTALEKSLISIPESAFTEARYIEITGGCLEIEEDEPPVLRVLDCICYNELVRATSNDSQQFIKITWYQRLFAHLFDINQHRLSKVS